MGRNLIQVLTDLMQSRCQVLFLHEVDEIV